jgi:pimeloyl-ACP methyl ester carboxylesterase
VFGCSPTPIYFHEADRGGHFAMWEDPELFATELRAAFKPLRKIESTGRQ